LKALEKDVTDVSTISFFEFREQSSKSSGRLERTPWSQVFKIYAVCLLLFFEDVLERPFFFDLVDEGEDYADYLTHVGKPFVCQCARDRERFDCLKQTGAHRRVACEHKVLPYELRQQRVFAFMTNDVRNVTHFSEFPTFLCKWKLWPLNHQVLQIFIRNYLDEMAQCSFAVIDLGIEFSERQTLVDNR
jgi:hypothetical protein